MKTILALTILIISELQLATSYKSTNFQKSKFSYITSDYHPKGIQPVYSSKSFESWSTEDAQLYGIDAKNVAVGLIGSDNIRGVQAIQEIKENDIIITVPANIALETANNRPPTPFPTFISQEIWGKSMWDQRLAFKLLHEININSKKSNELKYWIDRLPQEYSTTYYWDDKSLNELQYPALVSKVKAQRQQWTQLYQACKTSSTEFSVITMKSFVAALECVNSRAFSGTYEGSSASERQALFFFTGMLTLLWPILHLGSPEQAISAAISVGVSIVVRDFFLSKVLNLKRYVVCPYIDMLNHDSNSQSDVSYNYFQNQFEVSTKKSYSIGDQVFISYGKQSNDRFLQYYGFVEADNPSDVYDYGIGVLEVLLKYGDALQTRFPTEFPSSPTPTERLQILAGALRNTNVKQQSSGQISTFGVDADESNGVLDVNGGAVEGAAAKATANSVTADKLNFKILRRRTSGSNDIIGRFDDISVRIIRGFFAYSQDWEMLSQLPDSELMIKLGTSLPNSSEGFLKRVLKTLAQLELESMPTSLNEDLTLLEELKNGDTLRKGTADPLKGGNAKSSIENSRPSKKTGFSNEKSSVLKESKATKELPRWDPSGIYKDRDITAISFRIEKKKLLNEVISSLTD